MGWENGNITMCHHQQLWLKSKTCLTEDNNNKMPCVK